MYQIFVGEMIENMNCLSDEVMNTTQKGFHRKLSNSEFAWEKIL